jgi:hypothetical protein
MTINKAALAITLLAGAAAPALAQSYQRPPAQNTIRTPDQQRPVQDGAQPAQPTRNYNLSRQERAAFQPVFAAVAAQDWATTATALPAAIAAARGNDAKYLVGQIRLQLGIGTNDRAQQSQAIDEMLASGGALPTELRALYENQLEFAIAAGDTAKAQRAMTELDRIAPNDPTRYVRLARLRVGAHDPAGAIGFYQQAIRAQQAAGQPIPVEWRQQIAGIAYAAHSPDTMRYLREWLVAAPTQALWHDNLAIYAELGNANSALKLDVYRLMRAVGAMSAERDYIELSQAANEAHAFGEVKAVLEEGLQRNLIVQNAAYARERLTVTDRRVADDRGSLAEGRTAALAGRDAAAALAMGDAYYGYADYTHAAELYRAALQKGADAGVVNLRLGGALAMGGQRAEAEAAFRAVTGPRAELAQYWLLWLSTRS